MGALLCLPWAIAAKPVAKWRSHGSGALEFLHGKEFIVRAGRELGMARTEVVGYFENRSARAGREWHATMEAC